MTSPSPVVLVVTRNADEGEALCSELRIAGKRALLASGGRDALQLAAAQPPALVVQDVVLPDMDGATMIAALRQLPGLDALPAVALASSPPATTSDEDDHSFQELLIKPVDAEVLTAAAGHLLTPDADPRVHDSGRIVLADDNPAQRRLMTLRLGQAGYEVTATTDGLDALRLARAQHPDAVVSDVLMPGIDGFELTRALRSDERTRTIPVVLTSSAFIDPADAELAAAVGASTLVARTPDLAELLSAIDACLLSGRDAEPRTQHPVGRRVVEQRFGERMAVHLDQQIRLNAQLRERLAAQSVELAVLAALGGQISASGDAEQLLEEVLARCAEVTGFGCGAVYLSPSSWPGGGDPVLQGRVGFPEAAPLRDFFGVPELLLEAVEVAGPGTARLPSERFDDERVRLVLRRAGMSVMLLTPIADSGKLLGVLVLGSPRSAATSGRETFIAAVAAQLGQSLARVQALYALSRSQLRMVERLTRAAEFRDEESANHVQRVSRYAAVLADRSGVDQRHGELIAAGSMMHDIGKLGIPDTILRKPGRLSADERRHVERHAEYGRQILSGEPDALLDIAATIAWTHHERWDGSGYPRGLSADKIPLEGRIVAICEVFDALTSTRVYRPAMSIEEALDVMRAGRGSQFDPGLLASFLGALPLVLEIRARHPDVPNGGPIPADRALRFA